MRLTIILENPSFFSPIKYQSFKMGRPAFPRMNCGWVVKENARCCVQLQTLRLMKDLPVVDREGKYIVFPLLLFGPHSLRSSGFALGSALWDHF